MMDANSPFTRGEANSPSNSNQLDSSDDDDDNNDNENDNEREIIQNGESDDDDDDDDSWSNVEHHHADESGSISSAEEDEEEDETHLPLAPDRQSAGLSWTGVSFLLLIVSTVILHSWARVATFLPPPEPAEGEGPQEVFPPYPRTFHLVLTPRLSGTDGSGVFGAHFEDCDREDQSERTGWTLGRSEESPIPWHAAAVKISTAWLRSEPKSIFDTICNFRYASAMEDHYAPSRIKFLRLERRGNQLHFMFQETKPGSAPKKFLETLREEVRIGSDTWGGGDLGDITRAVAIRNGFLQEWEQAFAPPTVSRTNEQHVQIHVSLADKAAEIYDASISLNTPINFEKDTRGCTRHHDVYNSGRSIFHRPWYI